MDTDDFNIIEYICFELQENGLGINEFEKWVYHSAEIQVILSNEDYLDLISLDYNSKNIYYEIIRIMDKYIDYRKYETKKITVLLTRALQKDEKIGEILRNFYDMYCDGYYFLEDLGLGYGLSCEVPLGANTWEELSDQQRISIINSFYPQLEQDLKRALIWIESKKIVLSGKRSDYNRWEFIDNRTDEEKKSTVWIEVNGSKEHKIRKSSFGSKKSEWWKFWSRANNI